MRQLLLIAIAMFILKPLAFNQDQITESFQPPLDGIVEKKLMKERRVLPYAPIREADIFWQKRVWRVIDTREKMNLHFRYPKRMLFDILVDHIENGKMTAFYVNDADDFSEPLTEKDLDGIIFSRDTIEVVDPITYKMIQTPIENKINPEDITRFRVKEDWFFDENSSSLKVRIIGIAPLKEYYDDFGNFLYEMPLFWVHFPTSREVLAREMAYNPGNDNPSMTWNDIFEIRQFSSYIYKESNIHNRRLQGYLSGVDLLIESKRINEEIFNFEHDLWEF